MPQQPNILLITTDQQRFDTVRPFAPSFLRTPHLDFLQQEGVNFTHAYSDCPLCVPARCTILSGQYASTHGMLGNGQSSDALREVSTLPMVLNDAGYQTAAFGKMHFGPQRCRHGFQEMVLPDDYYRWMRTSGNAQQPMRHGMGQNELSPTMATVPESLTLTAWTAQQTAEYIRFRRDPTRPFFLWCSFAKPHPPLDPPEPYYAMYRNAAIPEPALGDWIDDETCPSCMRQHRRHYLSERLTPEVIREARAAYYGLITQIDHNIGCILQALQDDELLAETLVVFASDHGEYLGDHRMSAKSLAHESSAHVPLILRLPASTAGDLVDTSCETPVTLVDLMPTILAAAGAEPPAGLEGRDLAAMARGDTGTRRYAMIHGANSRCFGITDGRWKYIYFPHGGVEQLFDLERDPTEVHNLVGRPEHATEHARLSRDLIQLVQDRGIHAVAGGRWVARPPMEVDIRRSGNWHWPGFHSEHYWKDVRH
jgi:choline-sulfatase